MRLLSLACALFLSLVPLQGFAQSDEVILQGPTPSWVSTPDIPEATPGMLALAEGGYLIRKIFSQSHFEPGADYNSNYSLTAVQVTDRSGLEAAATVQIDFDPLTDRIVLHELVKLRDGKIIDETAKVQPEILRRESQMDIGIFTGQRTAVYQIPDLRVGDLVRTAYTVQHKPLLKDVETWGGEIRLSTWVPVVSNEVIIDLQSDETFHVKGADSPKISYRTETIGDVIRHIWKADNVPADPEESGMPLEFRPGPTLEFSNMTDWRELSASMARRFPHDAPLPAEWQAKVDQIMTDHETPPDRAFAALRLVQAEIRYVSLAYGTGGYEPRSPTEVIASGFGDCKDKTLLLMAMLDRMGISSDAALANLGEGRGLAERMPSLNAFNHAILRVDLHGRSVWMDPTGSHEAGGVTTAARLDYGWALPLTHDGSAELVRTEPGRKSRYILHTTESYSYTLLGVWLDVHTEYDAGGADAMRGALASGTEKAMQDKFWEYQQERYPGIELVGQTKFKDRPDSNRIVVDERYFLPKFAMLENGLMADFVFGTEDFMSSVDGVVGKRRLTPFVAGDPLEARLRVEVKGFPINFLPPEPVTIRNESFVYDMRGSAPRDGAMTLFFRFDRTGAVIPASDYSALVKDTRKFRDNRAYYWNLYPETE